MTVIGANEARLLEWHVLDVKIQRLMQRVIETARSHEEAPDSQVMEFRDWEFIFSDYEGWTVLRAHTKSRGGCWIYPLLVPISRVDELKQDLPSFSFTIQETAYDHVISGEDHRIDPFWEHRGDFREAEIPLFFKREYYGHPPGKEGYIEFNQVITHPLGLHWSGRKGALCTIDRYGEEKEKVKVIETADLELILIRRRTLDKLLHLGKWVLFRYVEFTQWKVDFPDFGSSVTKEMDLVGHEGGVSIRQSGSRPIEYVEIRGAEIQRAKTPKEELLSWSFRDEEEEEKRYADFIVQDWKNKRLLRNYSINPENFSNYFTKSDKPFEISPIFFRAEVLDKYKNDPDRFRLGERNISCRGGWRLETYDINEYGQVHTYAIYLSRLPYREQLHWLQYNEDPKGAISERAIRTDFEAKFPKTASPMERLRRAIESLSCVWSATEFGPIWLPKGGSLETAMRGLHYVNTENRNQWHDYIIALSNTTVEGLQRKALVKVAERFGYKDPESGTLHLLKVILEKSGNAARVSETHGVFADLRKRRGQGKAHGNWETPEGSLIADSESRMEAVINAVEVLAEIFATLSIPGSADE